MSDNEEKKIDSQLRRLWFFVKLLEHKLQANGAVFVLRLVEAAICPGDATTGRGTGFISIGCIIGMKESS